MPTVPPMLRALLDLEAVIRRDVGVATTATARSSVVYAQLDLAQGALSLDHRSDSSLGLVPQW